MDGEGDATYIWGTNLSVSRIQSRFNVFIREFREEGKEEGEAHYLELLKEVGRGGGLVGKIWIKDLDGDGAAQKGRQACACGGR